MHNRKKTQKDGSKVRPFLLCDHRLEKEILFALEQRGRVVLMPSYEKLPTPICAHPDILCFYDGKRLFTYEEYYRRHRTLFSSLPVEVCPLPLEGGAYPLDTVFDHLLFMGALIGRVESMHPQLIAGRRTVGVKQGYARCSALPFGERLITADEGIARAARTLGGQVLTVRPSEVKLPGYSCGMIGGASAIFGREVLFFGELSTHRDGVRIEAFLKQGGYTAVSLSAGPLTDCGGMLLLSAEKNG